MKRLSALLLLPLLVTGCSHKTSGVTLLPSVTDATSLAPNLFTAGNSLYISWLEPGDSVNSLWFARWDGSGWVSPTRAEAGSRWIRSGVDIPKVLVRDSGYSAAWLERIGDQGEGYGVKTASGGAEHASNAAWLHGDTSDCEHGFVSLVQHEGSVQAVWLDGRETVTGGPTTLRTATLTHDGQVEDETVLDPRVCDCCPTSVAECADGALLVAYRDRSDDEVRDIAVMRLAGGYRSNPHIVYRDEWKIAGCPVNGPALAVSDSLVALAWFGMSGGVDPTVHLVFSHNGGETFGAPIRVDRRHAEGRVDLTFLADGRALVVWLETTDSANILWARSVSPSGHLDTAITIVQTAAGGLSGIPSVEASGQDVLVAWTEATEPTHVRTAKLSW